MPTETSTFRMPAEWEPQQGTLLAWPHQRADWPGKFPAIPWVFGEIVRILARYQPVWLVVKDAKHQQAAMGVLKKAHAELSHVHLLMHPTDRGWMRDAGPIVVKRGDERVALDWGFNAWAKYDNWQHDDALPPRVANDLGLPVEVPMHNGQRVILEGGGIDVNGQGLLLTTEEWLLSNVQVRNPGFTRDDYEQVFATHLGISKTIWLGRGIAGDDTHGHVDDITRFVNANTVVTVVEPNERDDNHGPLKENKERLLAAGLNVIDLPMPSPVVFSKQRLPASYANFLIANGVVIVPTFNDAKDRVALGILSECFPDRDIIGIHAVDLVWALGTLHCLSQQIPR